MSGDALVVIDGGDSSACAAPCSYYIGVSSPDASAAVGFVLLVHGNSTGGGLPTPLRLGDMLLDAVSAMDYCSSVGYEDEEHINI